MSQLAKWKCHKIVRAGKIIHKGLKTNSPVIMVEDVNGAPCPVEVPPDFYARGAPSDGDYVVIYDDEYKSWSPATAFESGYARLVLAGDESRAHGVLAQVA